MLLFSHWSLLTAESGSQSFPLVSKEMQKYTDLMIWLYVSSSAQSVSFFLDIHSLLLLYEWILMVFTMTKCSILPLVTEVWPITCSKNNCNEIFKIPSLKGGNGNKYCLFLPLPLASCLIHRVMLFKFLYNLVCYVQFWIPHKELVSIISGVFLMVSVSMLIIMKFR